jgi:hypothetical protein
MVYGPPGPVSVKSQAETVLHFTHSEKLKVSVFAPQAIGCITESIVGGTLSNITAVDAPKLML